MTQIKTELYFMRKFAIYTCLILLALLAAAYVFAPPFKATFTQAQIEAELAKQLPKQINTALTKINVTKGTVDLRDNNKVAIKAAFDVRGFTLEGVGSADVITGIRYDAGRFFLSDLRKENISFTFSDNSKDTIGDVKSAFNKILTRETEEAENSDNEARKATAIKVSAYVQTQLRSDANAALDTFLGSVPVYSLNGQGGAMQIAALALKDVSITDDTITATLSFQTFIQRIAGGVFVVLFFLVTQFWQFFGIFQSAQKLKDSEGREVN